MVHTSEVVLQLGGGVLHLLIWIFVHFLIKLKEKHCVEKSYFILATDTC